MASPEYLHSATKMLPVSDRAKMLSSQFLASAMRPNHPSHANAGRGPRNKKKTLKSAFIEEVPPFLNDGVLRPEDYNLAKNSLHTYFVSKYINSQANMHYK